MTMVHFASSSHLFWVLVALSFPDCCFAQARCPLITQAPRLDERLLVARGGFATCGYVSGEAKSRLTCPTNYSCTSTQGGWACCDQIECVGNYKWCEDAGENLCDGLTDAQCSSIYTSILSCSSTAPFCISYARSLSLGADTTEYSLGCGQASTSVLVLQTALGGGSPAKVTAASSTAFGQSSPSSNNGGLSPTPSSSSSSSSSGLSAGGTAGIVVPVVSIAVAGLAIVVGIVVGWWKKHQILWLVTCGRRGYPKTVKPQPVQGAHQGNTNYPINYPIQGGYQLANMGHGDPNYAGVGYVDIDAL